MVKNEALGMKWQVIPHYPEEEITVRHYKWLKPFGARLHRIVERDCSEFRFAYFKITKSDAPLQYRIILSIPIPWMKNDFVISVRHHG